MKFRKVLTLLLAGAMTMGTAALAAEENELLIAPAPAAAFTDVAEDAYYAEAVAWAAGEEITTGRGNGIFDPDATVTRSEAVTFLWRMAGMPEPTQTQTQTFTDVVNDPNKVWYETAVQWAVEKEITNGTGGGNFSPAVPCDRGMILTMLYRMEDRPWDAALAAEPIQDGQSLSSLDDLNVSLVQSVVKANRDAKVFTDLNEGDYYEIPVLWAMMGQILDRNQVPEGSTAVGAATPCVRGEMVYFLSKAAEYEQKSKEAQAAYDQWNTPPEPIEVGTIEKTVLLDKDGVKITADSIEYVEDTYDTVLHMTVVNNSKKQLDIDTSTLYVNTYSVSPATHIPVKEDGWTSYESVIVPAGETKEFQVVLNDLREKGITAVQEIEISMYASVVTIGEDGMDFETFSEGEAVTIKTSLYDKNANYDQEGTVAYDKNGLKVLVTKAENNEYMGPQITVYAYNGSKEEVHLEIAALTLDGETYEGYFGMYIPAGKRCVDRVNVDLDYENIPTVKEAKLTLQTVKYDEETWDSIPVVVFDPVTVTFDA